MDSAIGLSTMLAIGPENFRAMLDGFHKMDEHFRTAPFERNFARPDGLLTILEQQFPRRRNGCGASLRAITSSAFPAYLQQLTMESKRETRHLGWRKKLTMRQARLLG